MACDGWDGGWQAGVVRGGAGRVGGCWVGMERGRVPGRGETGGCVVCGCVAVCVCGEWAQKLPPLVKKAGGLSA